MGKETINLDKAKEANKVESSTATTAPAKKQKATKKNVENVVKKVKAKAELMYNYNAKTKAFPNGVKEKDEKKKFRTIARNRQESWHKKIKKAKGEEKAVLIAKATKWAARIYTKSNVPTFG